MEHDSRSVYRDICSLADNSIPYHTLYTKLQVACITLPGIRDIRAPKTQKISFRPLQKLSAKLGDGIPADSPAMINHHIHT